MKKYQLNENVPVLCQEVASFPNGISEAFDELAKKFPPVGGRNYYGISFMDKAGKIVYKVAAQKIKEDNSAGFESFVIPKGEYLSESITSWREHLDDIGPTFDKLLKSPQMDHHVPCIEWYKTNEEMLCMVKALE